MVNENMNNDMSDGTKGMDVKKLWYYVLVKLSERSGVSSCFF